MKNEWQPIETAPTDNKRNLYLARFDEEGKLQELDFDGCWEHWQESWELSHINGYAWFSANGIEEPTHWAYQDEPLPIAPQFAAPVVKESLTVADPAMAGDEFWRLLNTGELIHKDDEFLYSGDAWRKALPTSVGDKYTCSYRIARRRVQPASGEIKPQPYHLKTPHQNYLVFQGDKQVKDFGNHFYSEVEAYEFVTRKNKEILGDNF